MIISVLKTFFTIFFALTLGVSALAQEKEVSYNQNRNDSILYLSEKKFIDEAYTIFNTESEKKAYKIAHKLLRKLKSKNGLVNANLLLAYYHKNRSLIDSSNYYVYKSLEYSGFKQDSLNARRKSIAYEIIATNYSNQGLYDNSKKFHLNGINEAKKYNEKLLYYSHLHGLGLNYVNTKEYEKALDAFEECLTYNANSEIIYGSYINIGLIHAELKDYETSNEFLLRAKELVETSYADQAKAVIENLIAANYVDIGDIEKAIKAYKKAIKIANEHDLKKIALIARMGIGEVFLELENYTDAELVYSLASVNAIELGQFNNQLFCYDKLKEIALKQDDYKKAYDFAMKHAKIKDSVHTLQKDKEIQELEIKFQTLQKEKEIKLLQTENTNRKLDQKNQQEEIKNLVLQQQISQKENENKILNYQNASQKRLNEIELLKKDQEIQQERLKNQVAKNTRQKSINLIILYSFLILLIPIIALLVTYYQKVRTQKELNNKQEEINKQKIDALLKDKELEIIKTSIDAQDKERKRIAQELHDSIGGNLAAIKLQLNSFKKPGATSHVRAINKQIDDTYERVRSLSHNLMPKKFRYNQFSDVVQEYLTNIGKASNVTTNFSAYPSKEINNLSSVLQEEIFKILQELITNTIKHAQATSIEVQMNLIEDVLNIMYEDNGIGFKTDSIQEGIGLRNIKSRLRKIEGNLDVDSRINRGSIFNIEIAHTKTTTNEMSHTG